MSLFILNIGVATSAEEAKVPCRYKDGSLGLNSLDSFDCKLANKLSSDAKLKEEYKSHVDKKLAKKLAKKSSDVIEDLSLLDSYFDHNGIDLGSNEDVKKSCKLEKIATPQCDSRVNKNQIQKKLDLILGSDKYLPLSKVDNKSLYKRMLAKAEDVRTGNKIKDANTCPIKGNSGDFILNSQFTLEDAKRLIIDIKRGRTGTLVSLYKNYPQLNLLLSEKSASLKEKFENAMQNFPGSPANEKEFVDNFFKNKDVQAEMAVSVAGKCDDLAKSISKFVCEDDYPHLAMKKDDRESFFDEKEDEVFKEVSRGLSCEMEEKITEDSVNSPFSIKGTIAEKNDFYSKDVRGEKDNDIIEKPLALFCSVYLCKDEKIKKEMLSCKNGGPISSADIIKTCRDEILSNCDDRVQKYVSYVSSLERDALNTGSIPSGLATNSSGGQSLDGVSHKPRGFSSFYQNFLGVEGTIASEGKKVTPITIAEKKAEFVEKKIDIGSSNLAALSQNREKEIVSRNDSRQESIIPEREVGSEMDAHAASLRDAEQFRRSFQAQQFSKPNYDITKDSNGKSKKVKFTDTDSSTLDEMKKLRGELAEALGKVKGTEEEQLAAVADNNAVAITPKGAKKDPVKNLNQGEKERLDAYRDSLNNWENRLRTWQGNLSDRDVRANSGGGSSGDSKSETPVSNNDQYNIANNNSGSSVKLNKTATGGTAMGAKGDIVGERTPGTEKVEGEAGIVNSENLATLEKDSLKKLGIVAADSFIIKVRHKEKIYSVPVKTFNHGGKSMYVPLLNERDRELSKIVYESPLFKDYRDYQVQRQYKLDQI